MSRRYKVILAMWNLVFVLLCSQICQGATLIYTYDNLNRLTKVIYGDGTTEEFTYDAAGNRLTHVITDITPPTGEVTINSGNPYTTSNSITLTLSASDSGSGVSQMRFSNDGSNWSAWEPFNTTKPWNLSPGSGSKTIYVQFKDNAGNISEPYIDNIVVDTAPPSGGITINGGAAYTTNPNVTLTLSATDADSGVSLMSFSNDGITWTAWVPYDTTKAWILKPGSGIKTVYVQYRDYALNVSLSYSDTIALDTLKQQYTINPNAPYSYVKAVNQITSWQGDTDNGYYDLSLNGFDFQFYGAPVTSLRISTNGYITFGTAGTDYSNAPIPNVNSPNTIIAPFWDNLDLTGLNAPRGVYWGLLGTAPNRQLVIEWYEVPSFDFGTETYSFEVILSESTDRIKFQYLDVDSGTSHDLGALATVGIENFDGTEGEQFSYNTASLQNGLAIEFIPSGIPNPLNDTTEFVKQQYRDFLNREAEPGGLQYWVNIIDSGAMTRAQVIESFFWSEEFGLRIAPIVRLYFAYFLRIPDYGGLMFWINAYNSGWSLEAISNSFAGSDEFQQMYGALSNEAFVNLVYQNILGRAPDPGGYAFWVGELNSGRRTRGQVMIGFSESAEYEGLTSHEVYVTMMYVGMLRRSPEEDGFNFWVDYLDSGNSGLALIDGFLNSQEYADRFQ